MVNAAGDVVTGQAATGRLIVNPGDTILSAWGNTTFDQTVECFASAADRDAQWPTPQDGAVAYLADSGTVWLRRLGIWKSFPLGYLTSATGPANQIDAGATWVTIVTVSFPVTAGRRYRVAGYANGTQQTAAGSATRYQIQDDQGGVQSLAYLTNLPLAATLLGSTNYLYVPTSTKTATINLAAAAAAGVLRSLNNTCTLLAEDIGTV